MATRGSGEGKTNRRRHREEGQAGAPPWMVTYGDMMTLLMCFFVLLFAFSSIDVMRFRQVMLSVQGALGVLTGGAKILGPGELPAPTPPEALSKGEEGVIGLLKVMETFRGYLKEKGLTKTVSLELDERGLVVSFMDKVLFDLGEATLKPEAKKVLAEVAEMLRGIPNNIRIEGHTCDLPIKSPKYPSNWELSTARATEVLKYLVESLGFDPKRLSAVGYGEYKPKVPNTSEANRALNRRVDIVILQR